MQLVLDTNVLVQANNREHAMYRSSYGLVRGLVNCKTSTICVDAEFDASGAGNRSRIGGEYLTHLVPGMLAHALVQLYAESKRVVVVKPASDENCIKEVRKLVSDPSDRVFLRVAIKTSDRVLVSHDDAAFPDEVRVACCERWDVAVLDADDDGLGHYQGT